MLAFPLRFGLLAALAWVLALPAAAQNKPKSKPADDGWGDPLPTTPAPKTKTKPAADDGWGTPLPAAPKPKPAAKPAASAPGAAKPAAKPATAPKTVAKPAVKPAAKPAVKPTPKPVTPEPEEPADKAPATGSSWGGGEDEEPEPTKTAPPSKKRPTSFVKLSTDPAVFPEDARKLLDGVKREDVSDDARMFESTWAAGRFSPQQQLRIIGLAQQMVERRYKANPHYRQYFGALVDAVNEQALSGSAIDDLLTVFEKTMTNDPPATMARLLSTVSLILKQRTMYQGRTSSLKFAGGQFAFQYYDGTNPPPTFGKPYEPPKPEPVPEPPKPVEVVAPEPAKPAPKAKPKKAKPKPANDGWGDWGDPEPAASSGGDDGWGAPAKPKAKAKPAPKPAPAKPKVPEGWGDEPVLLDEPAGGGGWGDPPGGGGLGTMLAYATEPMPLVKGPVLVLKDVDLVIGLAGSAAGATDSTGAPLAGPSGTIIKGATGALLLTKNQFVGSGGTLEWEPKPGAVATAKLNQFAFDITKPGFKAEGVTLDYPTALEKPIDGVLDYRALRPGARGRSTYPRFASFTNNARLMHLGDGISYRGGFALAGARISTNALDNSLSTIALTNNDTLRLRALSNAFQLGDSLITADRAAVILRQGAADSITHPGVQFKYAVGRHMATMVRNKGAFRTTPYTDTYHQLEIGAEMVKWDIRAPYIDFSMITAKNQVFSSYTSKDRFSSEQYYQQKTTSRFHPLLVVYAYAKEKKVEEFYLTELAEARKLSLPSLGKSMQGLAREGFITFDGKTGHVVLKPKLEHYVLAAKGKKDYDHININSLSSAGKNATLDLQTHELLVRGVDRFNFMDDTAQVYMEPDSGIVRIDKNRNMKFSGRLTATDLAFVGQDFQFDYEGFYVDMPKIDSTIVRDKKKKGEGGKAASMKLTTRGKQSSGRLYLNRPDNKSGRRKLGKFPSFDSQSGAYVYFNDPAIQGGVYDTTVYFEVPPFRLDSLNGSAKAPVGLKGVFHSGGIFPDISTDLSIQEDGSSGFTYKVPPEGIPAYEGKGTLFNTIRMDNGGLQGAGKLVVKDAKLTSEQFVFYRDSAVAVGQTVAIAGSERSPKLEGADFYMKWFAARDSLTMTTQQDPFKLYDGAFTFAGTAVVTPAGLGGSGTLDGATASVAGENLKLDKTSFDARHALLLIKGPEEGKPALKAADANVHYDLTGGFAEFSPEVEGAATTELAGVQFKTSLPGGRWDFKKKRVTLKVPDGAGTAKSSFVSTRPDQLGLRFPAAGGSYDLEKLQLRATGVPYITVGDARVQPDSSRVIVTAGAQIAPFKHAIITMDTLTKFHRLYDGEIQIHSRTRFTGSASYRYANRGDTATIRFNDFRIDSASVLLREKAVAAAYVDPLAEPVAVDKKAERAAAKAAKEDKKRRDQLAANAAQTGYGPPASRNGLVTRARALVGEKEQVFVAPRIQYRGGMAIISRRRGFSNEGEGRLRLSKDVNASDWFAITDSIDPANIHIPIANLRAADGSSLVTGIVRSDLSSKLYPLYVGVKQDPADLLIFEVGDVLTYNKSKDEFTMGSEKRDGFEVNEGNVLTWNGRNGGATMRGKFNFINNNPNFRMEAAGFGTGIPDSGVYALNTLITLDTKLPGKSVSIMAANLAKSTEGAMRALEISEDLTSKLGDMVGSKAAKGYNQVRPGTAPDPLYKLSPKFDKTLVLSNVDLKWSRKNRAWYSVGSISVSNAGQTAVNAQMEGYLEIKRAPEGDYVELLLEPDPSTSYHFKFANGTLLAFSSWENFANEIIEKQPKEDYLTASQFGVWPGDEFQKDQFRGWFLKQYRSEEDRRKLKRKPASFAPPPPDTAPSDGADSGGGRKKKKKDDDAPLPDPTGGNSNFSPDPATSPDAATDTGKKKKKKKDEEPAAEPAAEPVNSNFSTDPPAEETGKKKKKKKDKADESSTDAFGEPTTP